MVTGANKNCKIVSLNVRGIRDPTKRRTIFNYLKDQKASFCFLQQTYSESSDENVWRNEWGGDTLFLLIHTDQTGFIKGRYIGENIRLICDLLEKTKTDKSSGILLSIDFRKAFDTLE